MIGWEDRVQNYRRYNVLSGMLNATIPCSTLLTYVCIS